MLRTLLQFTKQRREGGSGAGACVVLGLLAKLPDHRTMYLPTLREGRREGREKAERERRGRGREGRGEGQKWEGRQRREGSKEGEVGKRSRKVENRKGVVTAHEQERQRARQRGYVSLALYTLTAAVSLSTSGSRSTRWSGCCKAVAGRWARMSCPTCE